MDRLVLKAMVIPGAEGAIIWHRLQEKPIHLTVAMETVHLVILTIWASFVIRHSSFVIHK